MPSRPVGTTSLPTDLCRRKMWSVSARSRGIRNCRGMLSGDETLKGKDDARALTCRIGDTKAAEQERRGDHVAHTPHLELGPIAGVGPTLKFLHHFATKLRKNRRHRFVSREGPGAERFTKEGHKGSGLAIHMEDMRR